MLREWKQQKHVNSRAFERLTTMSTKYFRWNIKNAKDESFALDDIAERHMQNCQPN